MIKKLWKFLCAHNDGISIVTVHQFSAGCVFQEKYKYVVCSRCEKVLIDRDTLEEYTGAIQGRDADNG